jgi:hypothetical protein
VSQEETLSRRKFLGAAAVGAAGIAAIGSWAPKAFSGPNGGGERLVPPGKLGIQQWSVRDAITRLDRSVSGYLGGTTFPDDPTDLGPLVPLPGGFQAVFEYLASVGIKGFEFFQFSQGANGAITHAEIRTALDNAGMLAVGTHTGSVGALSNPATLQLQIEIAQILGYTLIGTAGDPSSRSTLGDNPANPNQIGWQTAADRANAFGDVLAAAGITWYWHPEQNAFRFFDDPEHPELSRTRRIDWWAANTNPATIRFEPDILHAYAGRARFPDPVDGSLWEDECAPADRLACQGRQPHRAAAASRYEPVHADDPADAHVHRRDHRGRGLDRAGLPGGSGSGRHRLQATVRRGRSEGREALPDRVRQWAWARDRSRAVAPAREAERAVPARPPRRLEGPCA